jgi:dihydroorotate dehydrogenase electron transfer subunit
VSGSATAAEPRTLAPPERRVATVTGVERLGAYVVVRALDPGPAPTPHPGQFYMLAASERWGGVEDGRPYLPRAFSHARAKPGPDGVELSFLLEEVGPGTTRLAQLASGEGLGLVGPLGIGFRPAVAGTRPLLVGGGIGAAPLLCLHDELGDETPVLLGFRSFEHVRAAELFRGGVDVATDDGSSGRQGLVTDLLREGLDADGMLTVFACGPPRMLEAVRAICAERGVHAQLALESGMACGFGACFGCVVPTRDGYLRLCVDGPVLDADRLETALVPGAGH